MVLAIYSIILYFGIRFVLQVWIPRGSITIKKCRVALGVLWLPLVTIFYWNYLISYVPGSFMMAPMPVTYFLAWVVFVVADTLYQFHTISKIPESNTQ